MNINEKILYFIMVIIIALLMGLFVSMESKPELKCEAQAEPEHYVIKGTDDYREAIEILDRECKRLNDELIKARNNNWF